METEKEEGMESRRMVMVRICEPLPLLLMVAVMLLCRWMLAIACLIPCQASEARGLFNAAAVETVKNWC